MVDQETAVSIPIRAGGLVKLRDIRDLVEVTENADEDDVIYVLDGELQWSAS
jgi:hypothetical protein